MGKCIMRGCGCYSALMINSIDPPVTHNVLQEILFSFALGYFVGVWNQIRSYH